MRPATRPKTSPNNSAEFERITGDDPQISVIGSDNERNRRLAKALSALAHIAPTMRPGELQVLLQLVNEFAESPHHSGQISSRDLAERVQMTRRNVQRATDSLRDRTIITVQEGTATRPAAYRLDFLFTAVMPVLGGVFMTPPLLDFGGTGGVIMTPPHDKKDATGILFDSIGGVFMTPPPITRNAGAPAQADLIDRKTLIDQVQNAKAKNHDRANLAQLSRWIYTYQAKMTGRDPGPPPPNVLAMLLTIATVDRIISLIQELIADRTPPGDKYIWYVTIALDRIAGITAEEQKQERAKLRTIARPQRLPDNPPPPAAAPAETPGPATAQPEANTLFAKALIQKISSGVRRL